MKMQLAYFVKNNTAAVSINSMLPVLDEILTLAKKPAPTLIGSERDTLDYAIYAGERVDYLKSMAASKFLESTNDVLLMVDADTGFVAGQLVEMAKRSVQEKAVVGVLSSNGFGTGVDGNTEFDAPVSIGTDQMVPMYRMGSRMLAVPRECLKDVRGKGTQGGFLDRCRSQSGELFYDFFRPESAPHPQMPDVKEYLNDGWAFSWRCKRAMVRLLAWTKPMVTVDGVMSFTVQHGMLQAGKRP